MMGSGEWGVGEGGIIDLDFIIPIQPETILWGTIGVNLRKRLSAVGNRAYTNKTHLGGLKKKSACADASLCSAILQSGEFFAKAQFSASIAFCPSGEVA